MKIKIKTNKRTRNIGEYNKRTNTFTKNVKKSKHLFKMLNAWSLDSYVFNTIILPNLSKAKIKITDVENMVEYSISALEFKEHAVYLHFKGKEDNKTQMFCNRGFFYHKPISKPVIIG